MKGLLESLTMRVFASDFRDFPSRTDDVRSSKFQIRIHFRIMTTHMLDLYTPIFRKLYDKYAHQPRIQSVQRTSGIPTVEHLKSNVIPNGYPLIFTNPGITAFTEPEVINLLMQHCGTAVIQIRRATFDDPGQYVSDRQIRSVTVAEYLRDFGGQMAYAGNQQLPIHFASSLKPPPSGRRCY